LAIPNFEYFFLVLVLVSGFGFGGFGGLTAV